MKTKTLLALFLMLLSFSVYSQEGGRYLLSKALALPENEYYKVEHLVITGSFENLYVLPPQIFKFKNLRMLEITNQSIRRIDADISKLTKLGLISIYLCEKLEELPKEIANLPSLGTLHISGSYNLKDFSFLAGSDLRVLSLIQCGLFDLPKEVQSMPNLTSLNLDGNVITNISANLCKLNKLETLNLSSNREAYLPDCIANLPLKTLSLWGVNMSKKDFKALKEKLPNTKIMQHQYGDKK